MTASASLLLFLFAGAGYSAILPLLVIAAAAYFAASRTRWRKFQDLLRPGQTSSTWTPTVAVVVVIIAVLWLVITILLFLAGNPAVLA